MTETTLRITEQLLGYDYSGDPSAKRIIFQGARFSEDTIIWEMFGSSTSPRKLEKAVLKDTVVELYMKEPRGLATCDMVPYRQVIAAPSEGFPKNCKIIVYHWSGKAIDALVKID